MSIVDFLKKQLLRCSHRTIDYIFLVKILIYESYKRCKEGRNNRYDWSLSNVNVKTDNVSYDDDKVYEEIVNVGYYYEQKLYRIVQEYDSETKQSIIEKFPLYTNEQINKYNSGGNFGKTKITSVEYNDEDVTELIKSYMGPLGNFYDDLVDSEGDGDGIHEEDDGESHDETSTLINKLKITGIKAWWILPQMLNNKDEKLVIIDQLLNEYEFGPFDIIKFKSSSKKNIFDDILNSASESINIDLSKIDNILDKGIDSEEKQSSSPPRLNKRTNIRAFKLIN
jgi:hypothetical protein